MPQWLSSRPQTRDDQRPLDPAELPADAGPVLLGLARATISAELGLPLPTAEPPPWLRRPGACFVTLTTAGALRGCIGSIRAYRPLSEDVTGNASAAAFRDPRFPPLTWVELADTAIEVSVLSPSTPLEVVDEQDALAQLRPGQDGLVLEYAGRRATYLPQVWRSVRDRREFLSHLKLKAGLPPDFWSDQLQLSRYTVTEFHEEVAR